MEENNNTHPNQNQTANANQPIADTTPIVGDNVNAIPEQETSTQQTNEFPQVVPEPVKIIIDSDNRKSTAPRIANIIAVVSVLISVVMFYYTFRLFNETKRANNIADSNYHLAKAAFDSSDQSGKDNYELAKKTFESSNDDAKKRFKIDSATLNAQINSLKENQKQFEIANRPFAQVTDIKVDTLLPMKRVYISYILSNFGKLPAKILSGIYDLEIGYKGEDEKFVDSILPSTSYNMNDSLVNLVISGNAIITQTFITRWKMTEWKHDQLIKGKMILYFLGKITYINFITKKPYENSFIYKMTLNPVNIIAIKNEEKEL